MYKILVDGVLFCDSRIDALSIIDPEAELEANSVGELSFVIPPEHPYYDAISVKKSYITVYRDNESEPLFAGICTQKEVDFWTQLKITCEGELTFLNDTIQRQASYQNYKVSDFLTAVIAAHNAVAEDSKQFTVGNVTVSGTVSCYTDYESTMDVIQDNLIDNFTGFLSIRHENGVRYLDYLAPVTVPSEVRLVQLGVNLIDYESNLDTTDIATVIIPLGAKLDTEEVPGLDARLTIKGLVASGGKDYLDNTTAIATYGRIEKVVEWDDITIATVLYSEAQTYLKSQQFDNVTIECRAFDLHYEEADRKPIGFLDYCYVISEKHGMKKIFIVSKAKFDLNNPENDELTLGINKNKDISTLVELANRK